MSDVHRLIELYATSVKFPDASGFEALEMLRIRSRIAEQERVLDAADLQRLEDADDVLFQNAEAFHDAIAEVAGNAAELRRRYGVTPSHWWWYLEKLATHQRAAA